MDATSSSRAKAVPGLAESAGLDAKGSRVAWLASVRCGTLTTPMDARYPRLFPRGSRVRGLRLLKLLKLNLRSKLAPANLRVGSLRKKTPLRGGDDGDTFHACCMNSRPKSVTTQTPSWEI
jgi:hypothetical protein